MEELLRKYPVVIEAPVAWGEMDAFAHVNNTVYFRWFESGRIAYFDRVGFLRSAEESGIGPILASTRCRFRIPLEFPDTVAIGSRVSEIGEDRFTMEYAVFSHAHRRLAAEGDGLLVSYDYKKGRKAPIPTEVRQAIQQLER